MAPPPSAAPLTLRTDGGGWRRGYLWLGGIVPENAAPRRSHQRTAACPWRWLGSTLLFPAPPVLRRPYYSTRHSRQPCLRLSSPAWSYHTLTLSPPPCSSPRDCWIVVQSCIMIVVVFDTRFRLLYDSALPAGRGLPAMPPGAVTVPPAGVIVLALSPGELAPRTKLSSAGR